MATGTGKTFTAFQMVWKLVRSGWLRHQKGEEPGRVLFLADRVVLRDQAYNAFGPFADSTNDPRFLIDGRQKLSTNRDLYFAIYHNLWAQEGKQRLYEQFPPDFFDLIIIDEAHRSGFGTWREILDYFGEAIHLGMTATPKQDENVDTYAYFCAEEAPQAIDPHTPETGTIQLPAYRYSLGQGIEDGFLATYKVHRIRTNVDKEGLHIQEALEKGAELFVPEDAELRDDYFTQQFEREIKVPDRTTAMVHHLAELLRRFGPMHKTIVFCVDIAHAQEVARLLNNEFNELGYGDDYATAIVSEEGEAGRRRLAQFQDSDKTLPVVATTAELLSTGVDAPAVRNVVFMKTLASPILFKQIIGRGTRVDPDSGKFWFRIIDYTGASRLLDPRWDKPPTTSIEQDTVEETASLTGVVRLAESGELLVGATISLQVGPNDQRGPIFTNDEGRYHFANLPPGSLTLIAGGPRLLRRQLQVVTEPFLETICDIELKPQGDHKPSKITVKGLEVTIVDEATFVVDGMNEPLTLERYLDYTREKVVAFVPSWNKLRAIWQDEEQRKSFLEQLTQASIHVDVLAEVLQEDDADSFDLLAYLAYDKPLRTRTERICLSPAGNNLARPTDRRGTRSHPCPAQQI
ncbi:MAG: DEAD/DEAH box helicase family protein [Caldilineaceae bacterium]